MKVVASCLNLTLLTDKEPVERYKRGIQCDQAKQKLGRCISWSLERVLLGLGKPKQWMAHGGHVKRESAGTNIYVDFKKINQLAHTARITR